MPDERTQEIVNFLIRIIEVAEKENKRVAIEGRIAIEIEAANLRDDENFTRNHHDLDFRVMEEDVDFWKKWFEEQKFKIDTDEKIVDATKAFLAYSCNYSPDSPIGFYVDVYGVKMAEDGQLSSHEESVEDKWEITWDKLFIPCRWNGHAIKVMKQEVALKLKTDTAQKLGQPLREIDLYDQKLFTS